MYFRPFSNLFTTSAFLVGTHASFYSPRASSDLICHTSHASECYPRNFQPSSYFQTVHDDQEIPPGLHIRVNLETGKKEAKINDNAHGESEETKDVVIVEVPDDDSESSHRAIDDNLLGKVPGQQILNVLDQGSIRPRPSDSGEGQSFASSRNTLKNVSENPDPDTLLPALDILEDLSHDIYWGLTLVKDARTVQKLVGLLTLNTSDTRIKTGAALVFGTALQNNPAALTAALSHCYNDELPTGPMEAVFVALLHEQLPHLLARFMYLLSALCKDRTQLMHFINGDGMEILLSVFDAEHAGSDGKDRLRLKVANFVLDHFLQPNLTKEAGTEGLIQQAIPEDEVETKLEHEDPWIMATASEDIPPKLTNSERKDPTKLLKPWCLAFSSSISNWQLNMNDSDTSIAVRDMHEVHAALEQKLAEYGCSCEEDCNPHREL